MPETKETDRFATGVYELWRRNRLDKIFEIFGKDFFRDKTILEVACGSGLTGKELQTLGADVTFTEGREENLKWLDDKNKQVLDQEYEWNLKKQFDIVIHWGVLYHLLNWKMDLRCTAKHTKDWLFIESLVSDSDDPNFELKVGEKREETQALNPMSIGSRPSAAMIERELNNLGFNFRRYDDRSLNVSSIQIYDWTVKNSNKNNDKYRRFWICRKVRNYEWIDEAIGKANENE